MQGFCEQIVSDVVFPAAGKLQEADVRRLLLCVTFFTFRSTNEQ